MVLAIGFAPNAARASDEVGQALAAATRAEAQGQYAQAELWLERALMLQPENAQARFDWARLLLRRGETESGAAMLQSLLQDPRTPLAQRERLNALLQGVLVGSGATTTPPTKPAATDARAEQPTWRGQWEAQIGKSRNPLVQPDVREVVLTLPQGNLTLPLEGSPRPGTVGTLRLVAEQSKGLMLQAQLQGVDAQGVPGLRLGALYSPWRQVGLYAQGQRLADSTRRLQGGVQWGVPLAATSAPANTTKSAPATTSPASENPASAFIAQLGLFKEPDGQRRGTSIRMTLIHAPNAHWSALVWAEGEIKHGDSGPPSWRGGGASWEFKPRSDMSLMLQVLDQKDTSGYSPLLENNVKRHLRTYSAQAEWALGQKLEIGWLLRLHAGRRQSNLPLFAWADTGAALLWRNPW
jgi:hypothetical protein